MEIIELQKKLSKLNEDTQGEFGIMSPQHMLEHLTITIKISYNRVKIPDFEPNEKQKAQKHALLETDMDFPIGVKAPGIPAGELMPLRNKNLEEAKEQFIQSIESYYSFFKSSPDELTVHPRFGKMSFSEWEKFHPKHIKHHFKQFGIW